MLVRYHWGLGIGHVYAQESKVQRGSDILICKEDGTDVMNDEDSVDGLDHTGGVGEDMHPYTDTNDDNAGLEMGIGNDEEDLSGESSSERDSNCDEENDEEFLELMDSYHTNY